MKQESPRNRRTVFPMSNSNLEIRDISYPLREGFPVWPGHEAVRLTVVKSHEAGDGVQVSDMAIGCHTGTHLDAPRHFIAGGGLVDKLDLHVLIGACTVVVYDGEGPLDKAWFEAQSLPTPITRLLLHCAIHDGKLEESRFFSNYVGITEDAAQYLVERGLKLIGTDYLSIGPFYGGNPETHRALLGPAVIIVEGLDLRGVAAGAYTLVCLPLSLPTDGAPCRAVLLPAGMLES
ncbi:MAG: cyclase family protein [Armatimonadetes bacterium]|nr:cyclase family protein [Armatimonadota bacterium]